ncbi:MAG: transporter substrate-binding domain-containing protein, partial [Saccharospirillum sp.]
MQSSVVVPAGRRFTGALAGLMLLAAASQASTLSDVRSKNYLDCGVSTGIPGFSNPDTEGRWSGLDVDICRAVAAAVLGDAGKVRYTPLPPSDRFNALSSGEVDMLSRNTTWTHARDTTLGMIFAGIVFYDAQGFMVTQSSGNTGLSDL